MTSSEILFSLFPVILVSHLASTLVMTGVMWLVQLSSYPLLNLIGKNFREYQSERVRRISFIAWFILSLELSTGALLVYVNPYNLSTQILLLNFLLIAIIWLMTFFVQFPFHKKLTHGFDKKIHKKLVRSNWIRAILYSIKTLIVLKIILILI